MKRFIIFIFVVLTIFRFASGQVTIAHLDAYLWEYPLQQSLVIEPGLMEELVAEMEKIIESGDLFFRPLPNDFADQIWDHYFLYIEPGRILKTIAMAYPYLDTGMQETLRTMVQELFADPVHLPWATGPLPLDAGKERKPFAPGTLWGQNANFGLYRPTIQNVYNIWLYIYRTGHIEAITPAYYSQISGFYNNKLGSSDRGRLYGSMKAHIGMARLAHLFGDDDLFITARNTLQSALNFGLNVNDVDTLASRGESNAYWDGAYRYLYEWHPADLPWPNLRNWDWANRNYIFHHISPEIGRYLQDFLSEETEARHDYMMNRFPLWWLRESPYFNRWAGDEGIGIPSSSFGTNVPLERWFRNADAETLASYMISSPVGIADSYWIEALVMAIEANATDIFVDVRATPFSLNIDAEDEIVTLPELIIEEGRSLCFSSTHTLVVGGNGNSFHVEQGANLRLEAGHTIRMLEGTTILGNMHAQIVSDGTFCSQEPSQLAVYYEEGEATDPLSADYSFNVLRSDGYRMLVYPNPTKGKFTLELLDLSDAHQVHVALYNLSGNTIKSMVLPGERIHQLSLPQGPPGIYFMRVWQGSKTATARIIRQ